MRRPVMERFVRLEEQDRTFDIQFWQAQSSSARFEAAWQLAVLAHRRKGVNGRQFRLQRTVENFQRREN